jgi:hypothetical protein
MDAASMGDYLPEFVINSIINDMISRIRLCLIILTGYM